MATSGGGNLEILDVGAALAADPADSERLLVYATVAAVATLPFGVSYRVIVLSPPDALIAAA